MTETQKKQKEIACTFGWYFFNHDEVDVDKCYENWCLTLEGKRLTAEEPEFDRFLACGPKKKRPLDLSKVGEKPDFITSVEQAYMDRMITTLQKKWHLNYKQSRDIGRDLFYSFVLPVYELGGQYGLKPNNGGK